MMENDDHNNVLKVSHVFWVFETPPRWFKNIIICKYVGKYAIYNKVTYDKIYISQNFHLLYCTSFASGIIHYLRKDDFGYFWLPCPHGRIRKISRTPSSFLRNIFVPKIPLISFSPIKIVKLTDTTRFFFPTHFFSLSDARFKGEFDSWRILRKIGFHPPPPYPYVKSCRNWSFNVSNHVP